jgi:hypothetical protein
MKCAVVTKTSNNGYAKHANPFSVTIGIGALLDAGRRLTASPREWRLAFFIVEDII